MEKINSFGEIKSGQTYTFVRSWQATNGLEIAAGLVGKITGILSSGDKLENKDIEIWILRTNTNYCLPMTDFMLALKDRSIVKQTDNEESQNDHHEERRITVAELIKHLKSYPPDKELYFGGLEFYRLKDRGPHVQVEFSETVYRNDEGKVVVENHR